jgi:hypothetical protein
VGEEIESPRQKSLLTKRWLSVKHGRHATPAALVQMKQKCLALSTIKDRVPSPFTDCENTFLKNGVYCAFNVMGELIWEIL